VPALHFPLYFYLGSWRIHPHWVFEALAYFLGFRVYLAVRRRAGDSIPEPTRWTAIAAAAVGAALGSKLLFLFENPAETLQHWRDIAFLMGGKTMVGGLIGGLFAVELVKSRIGERRSTGDLFVFPLIIGMAIGRIGCFLTGLADHTYGVATSLPWGIDFGDGIRRHPTQLYEIVFLLALGSVLLVVRRRLTESGDLFKLFMVAYLGWRFAIGFIQPEIPLAGRSAIQWACLATLIYYAALSRKRFVLSRAEPAMRTHG
jgi:phosphatidylglycerol---prolipoprotein diacylglyceryl transferase